MTLDRGYKCLLLSICVRLFIAQNLVGHGQVEGPDLLAIGNDLVWRQEEAVGAGVSQLHANTVGYSATTVGRFLLSPVNGSTRGLVDGLGDASDGVVFAMDGKEGLVGLVSRQTSDLDHISWPLLIMLT